jgi:hypothetical protein
LLALLVGLLATVALIVLVDRRMLPKLASGLNPSS